MVPFFLDLWIFSVHLEWPSFCSDPPDLARPLHGTATQPGPVRSPKIFKFNYNYKGKHFRNIWDMFHLRFSYSRFCWASPSSHGLISGNIDVFWKEAFSEYRTE